MGLRQKAVFMAIGLVIGIIPFAVYKWTGLDKQVSGTKCREAYPLTAKDLDCEEYAESAARMSALNQTLDQAVQIYISEGKADKVSVFVRDLKTRQWAAVHEFDVFTPASLMKVPIMLAYFKFAELQPSILSEKVQYVVPTNFSSVDQDYLPETLLQAGNLYTVEKLIEEMIVNSDNNSADILMRRMNQDFFNKVLVELGIIIPKEVGPQTDFLTAKTYANIYRMLYNSSYLRRDYSEKALGYLSRTPFNGIQAHIPKGVLVVNKFGEREVDDASGKSIERELHDCGIIYKEPNPYTVCVMTQGKDFKTLQTIVQDLSKIIYDTI